MIRIRQIKINVKEDNEAILKQKICQKWHLKESDIIKLKIIKKSIDARQKPEVYFIYEVDISLKEEEKFLKKYANEDIFKSVEIKYHSPKKGDTKLNHRPIIIGSGPAGLFCAYHLAKEGYKPIIIERGEAMPDRVKTVKKFWESGQLEEESNVVFGEGGAGTFSDGKLNTLVKDKEGRGQKAFEIFVSCGAKKEILYENNPHIGTDKLQTIIINMREKIKKYGGEFYFRTLLTDILVKDNQIKKIEINHQTWLDTDILVLALGHSARDTFHMLYERKLNITSKPFAVGLRMIHSQKKINESQYQEASSYLPPASYKVTYQTTKGRGVYSFCMCPGGYVVNASSEKKRLVINGMSESKRDTSNANAALIVTVSEKDYGYEPLSGINFQRKLEEKAYQIGKGKIPVQLYQDFIANKKSEKYDNLFPCTKGDVTFANLNDLLPDFIKEALKEAIPVFDKKIKGFAAKNALLLGIETRTSSPIKILRDEYFQANIHGIYPCGEGAGYAGGITSSAIDGIKISEAIISKYYL